MTPYGPEHITYDHVGPMMTDEIAALRRENAELKRQLAIAQDAERLQALRLRSAVAAQKYAAAQLHEVKP